MVEPLDPDAALMLRVRQGDAAAFEALVEKYKQPVANLIYRILRDATEAEDLAQQVFLQALLDPQEEPAATFLTEVAAATLAGPDPTR